MWLWANINTVDCAGLCCSFQKNHWHHHKASLWAWVIGKPMSSSLPQSKPGNSSNGQKVEEREKRQASRSRAQVPDAKQKHELPSSVRKPLPNSSVLGQKYTCSKRSQPSHYIQNVYVYISTSHIYKSVWILICLIVGSYYGSWGEIGTFCDLSIKYKWLLLSRDAGDLLLGNCIIHTIVSL